MIARRLADHVAALLAGKDHGGTVIQDEEKMAIVRPLRTICGCIDGIIRMVVAASREQSYSGR